MPLLRLAHLSDPHLAPPPGGGWTSRDAFSKRTLSRLSWARKRHRTHRPQVLAAIVADLAAQAPDHIAVTGDLTNFSTPAEFAAAAAWLAALGPAEQVTVSPGNHDLLVAGGAEDRLAAWAPWLGDGGEARFPHVRVRQGVALINLCSARPTPLFSARGEIGEAQRARLAVALRETGAAGLIRVVLLHHALTPGVVGERKALADAAAVREVLRREGAELVLHGHAHAPVFAATPGPHGPIAVLAAPSASARAGGRHPAARWHLIEIETDALRITARGLAGDGVEELGRYRLSLSRGGEVSSRSAA